MLMLVYLKLMMENMETYLNQTNKHIGTHILKEKKTVLLLISYDISVEKELGKEMYLSENFF